MPHRSADAPDRAKTPRRFVVSTAEPLAPPTTVLSKTESFAPTATVLSNWESFASPAAPVAETLVVAEAPILDRIAVERAVVSGTRSESAPFPPQAILSPDVAGFPPGTIFSLNFPGFPPGMFFSPNFAGFPPGTLFPPNFAGFPPGTLFPPNVAGLPSGTVAPPNFAPNASISVDASFPELPVSPKLTPAPPELPVSSEPARTPPKPPVSPKPAKSAPTPKRRRARSSDSPNAPSQTVAPKSNRAKTSASADATAEFFARLEEVALDSKGEKTELGVLRAPNALEQAKREARGWISSLVAHLVLLFCLALVATNSTTRELLEIVSQPGLSDEFVLDEVFDPETSFETTDLQFESTVPVESQVVADVPEISTFNDPTGAPLSLPSDPTALESLFAETSDVLGALGGDDLSGRGANKAAALATGGGSEGSEKSVALALAWLAEHQLPDGSWSFQFADCPNCVGACSHSGSARAPFAATAMGVLPFLAAGHTPTEGKYKEVVADALNCLLQNANEAEFGLDLRDSDRNAAMYSQGLAAIALCEAFAMQSERAKNRNPRLKYAAQGALRFIENAQNQENGGWRYSPGDPGDASVTGWQIMALKSGVLGGLDVDGATGRLALDFLRNVVAFDGESRYGYDNPSGGTPATTSAGLLCRFYLDWRTDAPAALAGADWILSQGPDLRNPYYNYYATQVLHHVGGARWSRWNGAIRDRLVETQSLSGHERGSWFPEGADSHCQTGGRLYATALNCMILEIYYRHMPLYRKLEEATRFPLEVPLEE